MASPRADEDSVGAAQSEGAVPRDHSGESQSLSIDECSSSAGEPPAVLNRRSLSAPVADAYAGTHLFFR